MEIPRVFSFVLFVLPWPRPAPALVECAGSGCILEPARLRNEGSRGRASWIHIPINPDNRNMAIEPEINPIAT
jgi:hypothetical protein